MTRFSVSSAGYPDMFLFPVESPECYLYSNCRFLPHQIVSVIILYYDNLLHSTKISIFSSFFKKKAQKWLFTPNNTEFQPEKSQF